MQHKQGQSAENRVFVMPPCTSFCLELHWENCMDNVNESASYSPESNIFSYLIAAASSI